VTPASNEPNLERINTNIYSIWTKGAQETIDWVSPAFAALKPGYAPTGGERRGVSRLSSQAAAIKVRRPNAWRFDNY
jgi:hypothetical protein